MHGGHINKLLKGLPMKMIKLTSMGYFDYVSFVGGVWKIIASVIGIIMMPFIKNEFYNNLAQTLLEYDEERKLKHQEKKVREIKNEGYDANDEKV